MVASRLALGLTLTLTVDVVKLEQRDSGYLKLFGNPKGASHTAGSHRSIMTLMLVIIMLMIMIMFELWVISSERCSCITLSVVVESKVIIIVC